MLTDQYLPSTVPGFSDARVYPLAGVDLAKAQALASGHLRGGKAVLYTSDVAMPLAVARLVKQQLAGDRAGGGREGASVPHRVDRLPQATGRAG